jgi:hypothetical protein
MRCILLAAPVLVLASFAFCQDKKPPLAIYPQMGADIPGPFTSYMVTGRRKTKFHCVVTEHALNPVVMVVMRGTELTPVRKYFLEKLDNAIHLNPNTRLAGFVIFQSDKMKELAGMDEVREEIEKQVLDVQRDTMLKHLQLALTTKAQLQKYQIDDQTDTFVLFYSRYRTISVYNLTKEQFTQEKVKEILSSVVDQVGGRKAD